MCIRDRVSTQSTWENHVDKQGLDKAFNAIKELNQHTNEQMHRFLSDVRLMELQTLYGDPNKLQIRDPVRSLVTEERYLVSIGETYRYLQVFILSDMVLFVDNVDSFRSILVSAIRLTENSFIKCFTNLLRFPFILSLLSEDGIGSFFCESERQLSQLSELMTNVLTELRKRPDLREERLRPINPLAKDGTARGRRFSANPENLVVLVDLIGTQAFGSDKVGVVKILVAQFIFQGRRLRIYKTYEEFQALYASLSTFFKGKYVPTIPNIRDDAQSEEELLEYRRHRVELFLTFIVTSQELFSSSIFQSFLQVHPSYFTPEFTRDLHGTSGAVELFGLNESPINKTLFEPMPWIYPNLLTFSRSGKVFSVKQPLTIEVADGQKVTVEMYPTMRVAEVEFKTALALGMTTYLDFRLFLVAGDGYSRMLFEDEIVDEALTKHNPLDPKAKKEVKGIINKISNFFSSSDTNRHFLIFKKAVYLSRELEIKTNEAEPVRMKLITAQILADVVDGLYPMTYKEYEFVAASAAYIRVGGMFDKEAQNYRVSDDDVRRVIPKRVLKTRSMSDWKNLILRAWITLSKEIQDHVNEVRAKAKPEDSVVQELDKKAVASALLINLVSKKPLYGCLLYLVHISEATLIHFDSGFPKTVFLAVKESGFDLIHSFSKVTLRSMGIDSVSYTHLRAHETPEHLVCRLLLEKKKN
eukprot:TRINITY_DN2359_c0_g1_i1.p1 TRINITY_DN2359_c0_g1~~TRINITY_DN2359_c0_g1_i1.p1  ORF type:complete len:699 (-),score=188.50 TRINITY_DN2359_c0_g1_i1:50-2146(-)